MAYDSTMVARRRRRLPAKFRRVAAADGAQALGFVREWFALLAPFSAVATPAVWEGTQAMYDDLPQWQGKSAADPGFDAEVWRFIYAATEQALARGEDIGPLPSWMESRKPGRTST